MLRNQPKHGRKRTRTHTITTQHRIKHEEKIARTADGRLKRLEELSWYYCVKYVTISLFLSRSSLGDAKRREEKKS